MAKGSGDPAPVQIVVARDISAKIRCFARNADPIACASPHNPQDAL